MNVQPSVGPGKKGTSPLVVVVIILAALGGCCLLGVLAAIAVPNFIKYRSRSMQGECKGELRSLYLAERTWFEQHQEYALDFNQLGVTPSRNRYTYFLGASAVKAPSVKGFEAVTLDALPALVGGVVVGVEGACPDCTFTVVCAANTDSDPALDVWSISSAPRGALKAGELSHDSDDLRE